MSDSAFPTAAYPSMTTKELVAALLHEKEFPSGLRDQVFIAKAEHEISRREAVEAGDYSNSTPGERLRAVRAGKDINQ